MINNQAKPKPTFGFFSSAVGLQMGEGLGFVNTYQIISRIFRDFIFIPNLNQFELSLGTSHYKSLNLSMYINHIYIVKQYIYSNPMCTICIPDKYLTHQIINNVGLIIIGSFLIPV